MKKIIQAAVDEKYIMVCDSCRREPEFGLGATVRFSFGYGSERDGDKGEAHFCDTCAETLLKDFQEKYPWFKLVTYEY